MPVHPIETYLKNLGEIYRAAGGTSEESYYGVLEALLDEIGSKLKPKVRCIPQLRNIGAGEPDFGLYTASQFQRSKDGCPIQGAMPERGVVEAKGWNDDAFATATGEQAAKYCGRYGLVLVTNYRDFVLVMRDAAGRAVPLESYRMAESENAFHALLAHPRSAADQQGDRLIDFLSRILLHAAPLAAPEDLAWFLASYAREARARVEAAAHLPALEGLKKGLEEALGMKFEGDKGEHFFRATLVQTLFYGVFSSWVLWSRERWGLSNDRFDWKDAAWTLHVPMIKSLFEQIATPSKLKPLGVDEVLNWAGLALNRVDRAAFFAKFEEDRAVQYFYEPFLQAYDPELRKELGVWYTPPEIVQYQVERVDRVLREELDIPDGLADDRVVILDPCCGTGAYLVETLKCIQRTCEDKGNGALTAYRLKRVAMTRLFGFEIIPAPFVVAHLQIGLMLHRLGMPFKHEENERAGVYLTNALTGWEPPEPPKTEIDKTKPQPAGVSGKAGRFSGESVRRTEGQQLRNAGYDELAQEMEAANQVKRDAPILVILGNPPYNAFAGTSPEEEGGLVEPYKEGLTTPVERGGWGIKKFNLDDLYVRFFRIAERRIAKSGKGIVSFISNFSYLGDPSFVVMRQRFLAEFDRVWIDCMNGDSRETGKLTPEGEPDPSVFSTEKTPVGIRVGTAVCLMVRKERRAAKPKVLFQHYWGVTKRRDLLASLRVRNLDRKYQTAHPARANRFSFRPSNVNKTYLAWPLLPELCGVPPYNGPVERRSNSLIVIEKRQLDPLKDYLDPKQSDEAIQHLQPAFMESSGEFKARDARKRILQAAVRFDPGKIVRYPFKPYDVRYAYLDAQLQPLFSRPSPALLKQQFDRNGFFITRDTADKEPEGPPFFYSTLVCDYDFASGHARHFPIRIRDGFEEPENGNGQMSVFDEIAPYYTIRANLSSNSRIYLEKLGIGDLDNDAETAGLIWMHTLAVGYSPAYLTENADGIRQDWPRVPLPAAKKALLKSAALGRRVAALLDTEKPVETVTTGGISRMLQAVAKMTKTGGGYLNPDEGAFDVTAGWGHGGKDGACMPGKGKIEIRKQKDEAVRKAFGDETLDVYLNDVAYWANLPRSVWEYYIGGYQVIKKWLSYREKPLLGRALTIEEAEYVSNMARRLAALILLQPDLDANYQVVKADTWSWPSPEA